MELNLLRNQLIEKSLEVNLLKNQLKNFWDEDIRNQTSSISISNGIISNKQKFSPSRKIDKTIKLNDVLATSIKHNSFNINKEIDDNNKINFSINNSINIIGVPNNNNLIAKKNPIRTFKIVSKKNNPLLSPTYALNRKLGKELKEISCAKDNVKIPYLIDKFDENIAVAKIIQNKSTVQESDDINQYSNAMARKVISRGMKRPSTVKLLASALVNADKFKLRFSNNLDAMPNHIKNRFLLI